MKGLIHIYCGDGKGKTTAATGLAVRAAGAGKRVLFVQLFKNGVSSEIKSLRKLGVETIICESYHKMFHQMNEEEMASAREDYTSLLAKALGEAKDGFDVLVIDEVISSCNHKIVPEKMLIDFLKNKPEELEIVMTGRKPSAALCAFADYISEVKKIKHPYDKGLNARKGIEY